MEQRYSRSAQGRLLDGKTFVGEFGKKGEKAEGKVS
jgi:hypothetical protein